MTNNEYLQVIRDLKEGKSLDKSKYRLVQQTIEEVLNDKGRVQRRDN